MIRGLPKTAPCTLAEPDFGQKPNVKGKYECPIDLTLASAIAETAENRPKWPFSFKRQT
jgi:hypothetical protein